VTVLARDSLLGRLAAWAVSEAGVSRSVVSLDLPSGGALLDCRNARLKLYGVSAAMVSDFARGLKTAAGSDDAVTKVIVYATPGEDDGWSALGLAREATIRGFHADHRDAHLWSGFFSEERAADPRHDEHERTIQDAQARGRREPKAPDGYRFGCAEASDAEELAALLQLVFTDYPSSLAPDHLRRLVSTEASFFVTARDQEGTLVATMSAEIDKEHGAAEMTDCATRPDHRGRGLMPYMMERLEREVPLKFGITDLYTIARADPLAINAVFARQGYDYTGRLVNNCRMPNGWESMNVWCKQAGADSAAEPTRGR